MASTFQRLTINGLPAPDLGSMLNPIRALNFARELTFKGITTLHISILGISRDVIFRFTMLKTLQWPRRLISVDTCYPHVKYFSIRSDLMEASNASHAFQLSTYCISIEVVLLELWSDFTSPSSVSITSRLTVGGSQALETVNGSCDARTRGHWKSGFQLRTN